MIKNYSRLSVFLMFFLMTLSPVLAQQVVFSRGEVSTGNFGDAQLPWFYENDNNSQGDPDNGNSVANLIRIGHNNNPTMTLNGRPYRAKELLFQSTADVGRTFDGFPLELRYQNGGPTKIENQSTAAHTFNNPIDIFDNVSEFNPVNGNLVFTGSITNNGNFIDVFGTNTLTISGIVSGAGGITLKQNGTLILSADNTYTGGTFLENGTLKLSGSISGSDVTVQNGATLEIEGNVTIKSLTVDSGGAVIVNPGQALIVTNNLINNGNITLESTSTIYSSLIVGNVSGTGVTNYNRHINNAPGQGNPTTANDLISPPLAGQDFGSFRAGNTNIFSGTIDGNGPFYFFGPYDNSDANDYVLYEETVDDGEILTAAVGYRTGSTDGGTYTFTGNVETGSINHPITVPSGGSIWNLIGNPYPSYISLAEFLEVNNGVLRDSSVGVYGYDGAADDGWVIWNFLYELLNPGSAITPGQGFFVASKLVGGTVTFNPNMRTIGATDDFIPSRSAQAITNLKLEITSTTNSFSTDIFFTEFSSLGLDPGYDASLWGGSAPAAFSVFTHLVEDNSGVPFAIQALGVTDYGNSTIALGVNANQGEQLTFSITETTIPQTVDVYLDDSVANTSTLLTSGNHIITPSNDLNGTGRFFLRFFDSSLSTNENTLDKLKIYINQSSKAIIISGPLLESSIANIYDVKGRRIVKKELKSSSTSQTIDVSGLASGIYIVQISNVFENKTQKVIISY